MDAELSFGRSPSAQYRVAVRLASALPGYRCEAVDDGARHGVPFSEATLPLVEELLRLVCGWQSTRVTIGGFVLHGPELWDLLEMLRCHRRHERSGLGALHCQGLPEGPRCRVPCRLIDRRLDWTLLPEYRSPELCARLVRAHAVESTAQLCPAFNAAAVVEALTGRVAVESLLEGVAIDFGGPPA